MALKPQMTIVDTDISYFVTSITGTSTTRMERGGVLSADTTQNPSGTAMDSSARVASYINQASGAKPLGILMQDFVNIDQSRQVLNPYKSEAQIGTKCTILRKGKVVTNYISGTVSSVPTACYNGPSGLLTPTSVTGRTQIGEFLTIPDADGYAEVIVRL